LRHKLKSLDDFHDFVHLLIRIYQGIKVAYVLGYHAGFFEGFIGSYFVGIDESWYTKECSAKVAYYYD
jgi:hypothetical protein